MDPMLLNVSYNRKEVNEQILELVGHSIPLLKRFQMRGIGSQRFVIEAANSEITDILDSTTNINFCNIELKQKGIMVWFRVKLHNYALAIPFSELKVTRSSKTLVLESDNYFVRLKPAHNAGVSLNFIRKLEKMMKSDVSEDKSP